MSKLEELRNMVAGLFQNAEDKETVKQVALFENKLNEAQEELNKKEEDYKSLLKDYKDVVIHSSFKPDNKSGNIGDETSVFDANDTLNNILKEFEGK